MDIESYADLAPQYYSDEVPMLLKKYLRQDKKLSYLDCGCGDGSLLNALNQKGYLKGKKVFAVDLSKKRISIVKNINNMFTASVDSVEELRTINDDSIDFLVSTQVIEHVDDNEMIKSIKRVLRQNGTAYITTVYKKWYGWYFYRNNGRWVLDPTHLREYMDDSELINIFDNYNFRVIENKKSLQWFPVADFIIKRLHVENRKLFDSIAFKVLRKIKVPIIGYYNWELIVVCN